MTDPWVSLSLIDHDWWKIIVALEKAGERELVDRLVQRLVREVVTQ